MRAVQLDVFIETGAQWTVNIQRFSEGVPVRAADVVPGTSVYVAGEPYLVHSVVTSGLHTTILFGQGLMSDGRLTVAAEQLVQPAIPVVVIEATAAFIYVPTDPVVTPYVEQRTEIPTVVSPDGLTVTLSYTDDETAGLSGWVGAHSWDLFVRTATDGWQRAVQGTLTIMDGDAR